VFGVTRKRKRNAGGIVFLFLGLAVCQGGEAYFFLSGSVEQDPVVIELPELDDTAVDVEPDLDAIRLVAEHTTPAAAPEAPEGVIQQIVEEAAEEGQPEPVVLPVSNSRVSVVRARVHTLEKPDPFLEPYQGHDIAGIEDLVRDISKGREDWRKEARKRIEKHRKEDLHLKIVGRSGKPFANQKVRVRLLKHKFHFGVALKKGYFSDPDELSSWERKKLEGQDWKFSLDERFKLVSQFATQVGFANAFKYRLSAGNDHSHMIQDIIPRLREQGLSIRGHTLIWPGWKHMHKDSLGLKDDPAALRAFCEKQITEYAQLWDVDEWDVMNEPRGNHDVQDLLGPEIMAEWFKIAQANVRTPGAGLYLNDYKVISRDEKPWNRDNIEKYKQTIDLLLENGAPLSHLGFQNRYHLWIEPEEIFRRLELFRDYGLPMKSTEFEIRDSKDVTFSEEERARLTAEVMTVWFSHDMVDGIMGWTFFSLEGSIDEKSGVPISFSLLYNTGIKLNGKLWLYLVHNHWHTDEVVKTDAKGVASVRGFLGDYEVLVRDGVTVKRAELMLDKEKNVYKVQL
jgi:hypothetical protein